MLKKLSLALAGFACLFNICALANLPEKIQKQVAAIEKFMEDHPDLSETLKSDDIARREIFSHHINIQKFMTKEYTKNEEREAVFSWYKNHINNYPSYFKDGYINYRKNPYLPQLRYQVWTNLYESKIKESDAIKLVNDIDSRHELVEVIGFQPSDPRAQLLLQYKRLIVDNNGLSNKKVENIMRLVSLLPNDIIKAESIRVRDYLGMQVYKGIPFSKRSGVNIFTNAGLKVVAHELNHTLDADKILLGGGWDITKRKYYLLSRAAGEDVVFHENTYRINKLATQALFKERGYWSGDLKTWDDEWYDYWLSSRGVERNNEWLRQAGPVNRRGIPFFIKAPQEILAGFANIYFEDSQALLDLCLDKWKNGYKEPINQFILFVDIYSKGDRSVFYKEDPNLYITSHEVVLKRSKVGHITEIQTPNGNYQFEIDDNGIVTEIMLCRKI